MEFNKYTVNDLVKLNVLEKPLDGNHGGIHPRGADFIDNGIPFITASDIKGNEIDFRSCKYISLEQAEQLKKGKAQENDVLITHKATIGRTAIVPKIPFPYIVLSPQVTFYRVKNYSILNNLYLKYFFDSSEFQNTFLNWSGGGSTRLYLGISAQGKLPITIPSITTQEKIVSVINKLELKIKNNKKLLINLEQLAQTLFKHWFIDFEFPNEEGKPYKSSGGEMVKSELMEIPKGWGVKSLDEIAKFQNGLAMQKFRPKENVESLPVLKIKELNQGSTNLNSERCALDIKEEVKVFDGDVIFSWSGTLLVKLWTGGNAGLNQHLFKVTSEEYEKWFYYLWTRYYLKIFQARAAEKATTMGHIKRSHLNEAKIYLPSQGILVQASKLLQPIIEKIISVGIENKNLTQLLDTLLPKLLSGEIEIPDNLEV